MQNKKSKDITNYPGQYEIFVKANSLDSKHVWSVSTLRCHAVTIFGKQRLVGIQGNNTQSTFFPLHPFILSSFPATMQHSTLAHYYYNNSSYSSTAPAASDSPVSSAHGEAPQQLLLLQQQGVGRRNVMTNKEKFLSEVWASTLSYSPNGVPRSYILPSWDRMVRARYMSSADSSSDEDDYDDDEDDDDDADDAYAMITLLSLKRRAPSPAELQQLLQQEEPQMSQHQQEDEDEDEDEKDKKDKASWGCDDSRLPFKKRRHSLMEPTATATAAITTTAVTTRCGRAVKVPAKLRE
jgi:hypothetical protein